jgi:hypothetical protein
VHSKPADYLDSFNQFIREPINHAAALKVVFTRRDLTREHLREIRLLDGHTPRLTHFAAARAQKKVRSIYISCHSCRLDAKIST